ncbi:EamA family transporter [Geodermatophilus maliterrae]|uniref:EamA family transporter n=1 Tax=Geodermatophilus maliterrae TaxID=3162531 RepID=A0ABV3XKW3_9ACTN
MVATTSAAVAPAPARPGHGWSLTLATAVAPATWGTTYVVTTEWLPPDRPLLAATVRALPAGLLLLAVGRVLPRGTWWLKAAVLGVLNIGAFFALLFVAAYRLPGGVAAVLGAAQPLLVAVLAVPLLGQRLRPRSLLLGVLGIGGVALIVLSGPVRLDPLGIAAGLAGTASMGTGVLLTKRWGRPVPVLAFTGWQLTAGGAVLLPLALAVEGLPPALTGTHAAGLLYLATVNTALAYALWLRGIGGLPADRVSFLGLLSPVVATVVGWLVLDEGLTALQLAGTVLALSCVVLAQRADAGAVRERPTAGPARPGAATG